MPHSIQKLNYLAKHNKIQVKIGNAYYTLNKIKYLRRDNKYIVCIQENCSWYYIEDCKFYTLKKIQVIL